jgi:hypothetical protein
MAHRRPTRTPRRRLSAPPRHCALIISPLRRELRSAARDTGGVASNDDAHHSRPLAGDDLEELACSAYLLGDADGCRRVLQRAQRAYWEGGNRRRAARCLFWVGFTLLLEGELAQAGGWLARTRRLVEHEPECPVPTRVRVLARPAGQPMDLAGARRRYARPGAAPTAGHAGHTGPPGQSLTATDCSDC